MSGTGKAEGTKVHAGQGYHCWMGDVRSETNTGYEERMMRMRNKSGVKVNPVGRNKGKDVCIAKTDDKKNKGYIFSSSNPDSFLQC
jgi:hypothetical protein